MELLLVEVEAELFKVIVVQVAEVLLEELLIYQAVLLVVMDKQTLVVVEVVLDLDHWLVELVVLE